jgi:predicted amidohydrolase YtcJ
MLRPDQMSRYASLSVLASLRGYFNTCEQDDYSFYFGPDRYQWLANRYALPRLGIHVYAEGDFGWTTDPSDRVSPRTIDPLLYLYGLVTHEQLRSDGTVCQPDQWIAQHQTSVEEGLRLITIEPAYAVSQEEVIGSLRPGKFADLVILSGNPLAMDPTSIRDLRALMTMVGGRVEYCAPGQETLCPEA